MSSDIDYASIEVPADKPATEYTYAERRADLLQRVYAVGHPRLINQTKVAGEYGVSQQQVSKDLDTLAEFVRDSLGARRDLISEAVYQRAITGLLDEGKYRQAARTITEWNDWIDRRTSKKTSVDETSPLFAGGHETEDYLIVPDEEMAQTRTD